jgi:hypothetical protein
VADRSSLAVESAAMDGDLRVVFIRHTGRRERLSGGGAHRFDWEIVFECAAVDDDLASAASEANPRDGGLTPAGAGMLGNFWLWNLDVSHLVIVESLNRPKLLCRSQRGRLLSGVGMFFAFIDLQLGH